VLATLWAKGALGTVTDQDLGFKSVYKRKDRDMTKPQRNNRREIRTRGAALLRSLQKFKKVIDRAGGQTKPYLGELDDSIVIDNTKLCNAFEHHDHTAFFEVPADNASKAQLKTFFTEKSNDIKDEDNRKIARLYGISVAVKFIKSQENEYKLLEKKPAPTSFTVQNANFDQEWEAYVDGLLFDEKTENAIKKEIEKKGNQILDTLVDKTLFFSNTTDDEVWGGDNNGSILLSSGDSTYMLDANGQLAKSYGISKMRSFYAMGVGVRYDYSLNMIKAALRRINGRG
jgi:hypothetical protein